MSAPNAASSSSSDIAYNMNQTQTEVEAPLSSPPSVKLLKVLHLEDEDESPVSTAPGSPELPACLLFENVGEATWDVSELDAQLEGLKLGGERTEGEHDLLPALEGLSIALW